MSGVRTATLHLEVVRLPDGASQCVAAAGLVLGVLVERRAVIAWAPIALPEWTQAARLYVVVRGRDGARCNLTALYLGQDDGVHGISDECLECATADGNVFDLPLEKMVSARVLTMALDVAPEGTPVVVRAAWLEVFGPA